MSSQTLQYLDISRDNRGVVTISLNRPERHNAFDDRLLAELHGVIGGVGAEDAVRVVVLAAHGNSFCAGADLDWMRRKANSSEQENYLDALGMAHCFRDLALLPKPTVAVVQGPAYGGGVGLVAACDLAIASVSARFAISEVRLGLIPAVISPYLERALGARQTRRLALTGQAIDGEEARELGLVHEVVADGELARTVAHRVSMLLANGPAAMREVKARICGWQREALDTLAETTARDIATIRAGAEAREGVAAFLGKRSPGWQKK